MVNSNLETEKNIHGSVLPILDRLHKEIKNKAKELSSGAQKSAKEVDKARNATQQYIEMLGQQTANHDSAGSRVEPLRDPYVIHRGVFHRLNKQVLEENNNKHDIIAVQNNFAQFETHIVEVVQQALMSFNQFVGSQAQKNQTLYQDMLMTGQQLPPDFEWQRFADRSKAILIDPNSPDRSLESISFPNQGHKSTKPLIEGTLERKSRNKLSMAGYSTGYYVVTPSKFLHEFEDNDNYRKDPVPKMSIYLPDATIGATNGEKFNVKGKDVSGGIGSKLSGTSEIAFKAHTFEDAQKWFEVIRSVAGAGPALSSSDPSSPTSQRAVSGQSGPPAYAEGGEEEIVPKSLDGNGRPPSPTLPISQLRGTVPIHNTEAHKPAPKPAPISTAGVTGGETVASPAVATPAHTEHVPAFKEEF